MIARLLELLSRLLPRTTISVGGRPYLTRFYLFGKDRAWGNAFLHRFHSSDQGDELHNHPWKWGASLILAGGYDEEYRVPDLENVPGDEVFDVRRRRVLPGTLHRFGDDHFHRVDLLEGEAWTLFFAGPRTKDWGFWDRHTGEFKDWRLNPEAIP
jgi:hypothetical protein